MRIGIDIGKALGVFDGICSYTLQLVRTLMQLDHQNRYLLYDLRKPDVDPARFRERFPAAPENFGVVSGRLPRLGEVDVFHGPAFKLPPGRPARLVFTLHDLTFLTHPTFHTLANRVEALTSTAVAVCCARRLIAVSAFTRDQALELLGLPGDRIEVVHNGCDPAFAPPQSESERRLLRERFGIQGSYLLTVGSLEPRKNLLGLIAALQRLPAALRQPRALVVAGGPGWRNEGVRAALEPLTRDGAVHCVGMVSQEDLRRLYGHADCFVYPSFAEGFGLPVVEAMACGAPVVTSKVTSLPEVAGDAALLVEPSDPSEIAAAVQRVLEDPALRQDLRRRGVERATQFSWRHAAERTLSLYREAAEG